MNSKHQGLMTRPSLLERVKWFVFEQFERMLVVALVASLLVIHALIDYKIAFLSFYYLPVIMAGFYIGKRGAVWSAVLSVALVSFVQAVEGFAGVAGLDSLVFLTLVPWGGFLILTGYAVGTLADQRKARLVDLQGAYITMLELLTFHLESSERSGQGHSYRVAERSVALARELGVHDDELEEVRVAALLHELGPQDPRLLRLFEQFPRDIKALPIAGSMRAALDMVREYRLYHENISVDIPVDAQRIPLTVKILAVADAYETLQMPSPNRPPFSPWGAVEEIERGAGQTFGSEVVRALKKVANTPVDRQPISLEAYREKLVG
jgi:HD-GYP domain-containing protein (c-di-GMP phosphodiesterase class II)